MKENQSEKNKQSSGQSEEISSIRQNNYVRGENSGKWSQEEHMKYIAFIDHNRQKMKSREKRRSNKFYQEMSTFISTRNALQCRSHHQKLEEKYIHLTKIIFLYKNTFDLTTYNQIFESIKKFSTQKNHFYKYQADAAHRNNSVQIQTDIGGLELQFVKIDANLILIRQKGAVDAVPQQTCMPFNASYLYPQMYNSSDYTLGTKPQTTNSQPHGLFIPTFNQH